MLSFFEQMEEAIANNEYPEPIYITEIVQLSIVRGNIVIAIVMAFAGLVSGLLNCLNL